jgi:hypothetical protein
MKKLVGAASLMMLMMTTAVWAQQAMDSGAGRSMRGRGQMMYDPAAVETLTGEVAEIKELTSRSGSRAGVALTLNTGGRKLMVHLGRRSYIDGQALKLAIGDNVEISGVKTVNRGEEIFIAGAVKKGGAVLKLRDESGRPLWLDN